MNNPRDYLPAKYKRNTPIGDDFQNDPPKDSKNSNSTSDLDNSPWSDLAKEPQVPSYRSSVAEEVESNEKSVDLTSDLPNLDTKPEDSLNPTFPKVKSKANNKKLAGLLVLFFLVVGVFSSYLLTQQSQDNRQQAHNGMMAPAPPGGCGSVAGTHKETIGGVDYCVPNLPEDAPLVQTQGRFGWCWDVGAGGGVQGGHSCSADEWKDPTKTIAGTYVWPPGCVGDACKRYVINIPSTLEAAVNYATQLPQIRDVLYQASGNQLEIAPFFTCASAGSSGTGSADGYNSVNCDTDPRCGAVETVTVSIIGQTPYQQTRCYLTQTAYNNLPPGQIWSPYNTGCGDGVHDNPDQTTIPGVGNTNESYAGDCSTWHFTQCLNEGTGVNGLGCDIIDTPNITTEEPPDEPPTEPPTTQPPTGTPTGTPTAPPELLCTDLEMLNSLGDLMEGDDDQDLISGDQVRFRGSSSDDDNPEVTFEFRILPPNTYAWQNLTNTSSGSTAKNISAPYTVISSGHHIVQSRVCLSGVCQAWESNDEVDDQFTSIFEDVPVTHWAYRSILAIYNEEITSGCSSDPLRYCPETATTRGQAATLIMKAKYGADYNFTLAATPVFADVAADNTMRKFIEKMYADGITAGCSSNPLNFCPDRAITRAEMAVMLERAFLR